MLKHTQVVPNADKVCLNGRIQPVTMMHGCKLRPLSVAADWHLVLCRGPPRLSKRHLISPAAVRVCVCSDGHFYSCYVVRAEQDVPSQQVMCAHLCVFVQQSEKEGIHSLYHFVLGQPLPSERHSTALSPACLP